MVPIYEHDLPIKALRHWPKKTASNWLSPKHGPLPEYLGQVSCANEVFICAAWFHENAIVLALEMLERGRRTEEELRARAMRGTILQTYYWKVRGTSMHCRGYEVPLPPDTGGDWTHDLTIQLMCASVEIAVTTTSAGWKVREVRDLYEEEMLSNKQHNSTKI